jgi:hypothetical protein
MAIVIHIPENQKSVSVPFCNSLSELSIHSNYVIQKLAYSHLFFQKVLAYCEVLIRNDATKEEVEAHLEEFTTAYNTNSLDYESTDPLSTKIVEILNDDDFTKKYEVFLRSISGEVFKLFASGAIAHEEGEASVEGLPMHMRSSVAAQA